MKSEEILTTYTIGNGISNVNEICYKLGFDSAQARRILKELIRKHFVKKSVSGFFLSNAGLLELSRHFYSEKCMRTEYLPSFAKHLPYLPYDSRFGKEIIFHPELFFDPASPVGDFERQLVYEISFQEHKINLDLLEAMCNLLYEYDYLHPTGFWLLKSREGAMCGYGIKSLRQTLWLFPKSTSLVFVIGFENFIIVAKSASHHVEADLRMKIYLTRDVFPYIDTMDSISQELKMLWILLGIKDIPRGREIQLNQSADFWPTERLYFAPNVYGRIIWKDKTWKPHEIDPLIIAFPPPCSDSALCNVSPWLATCAGGFFPGFDKRKTKFRLHFLDVLNLPEIDIVTLILSGG